MGLKTSTEAYERVMCWRRRDWFGAPVCSTVTAKYHERSQNCEWIWIQVLKGRNRARDRHKNIEGSWAGSLHQQSSVFHLLFLGSLSETDLGPVVSPLWEAKWKWSTHFTYHQVREEEENMRNHSRHHKWHQERMHLAKTLLSPCKDLTALHRT